MSNARPQCISGTFHNDGARISSHIRKRQAAELLSAPDDIRSRRTPDEWRKMYAQAMIEKRKQSE